MATRAATQGELMFVVLRGLCETPLVLSGGSRGQSAANASPEFLAVEEVLLAFEDGRRNDANAS
jgi:hypothetical protein